ncbi:MAG TPA: hypothetical protein PK995_07490 [Bacteroidia bacterium]|nr:hypothetical protein [Bacteroidia bacterium]
MSVTKISEKFTDKKNKFNTLIGNPTLFNCNDFNIIKLFQYAIFREHGFNARPFWKLPNFLINFIFFIKRLKLKRNYKFDRKILAKKDASIFIGDTDRYTNPYNVKFLSKHVTLVSPDIIGKINVLDTIKSKYYENIKNYLKSNNKSFVTFNTTQLFSPLDYDLNLKDIYPFLSILPLNEDDKKFLFHIRKTYKKIISEISLSKEKKKILEEIIQIFWQEYRTYRYILDFYSNLKLAFVIPHYQKEGLIYALKKRGIKVIELQHGLIAEEDMFYVYNKNIIPVKEKALFADEIWTYGQYWKSVLLKGNEYSEEQIKVFGYYLYYPKEFSKEFQNFQAQLSQNYSYIIFATAQKNLEHHLAEYINFLAKDMKQKNQSAAIVIKPHPSATQDISNFIDKSFSNIYIVNYPLEWLFQISNAHFSIYSTTLFDALMFNIKHNFALNHPLFSDYVEGITQKGVAKKLELNENILDKINNTTSKDDNHNLDPSYFYAPVNYELLKNEINSL